MLTSSGWRGGRGNVQAFAGYIAGLPVGTLLTSSVLWVIAGLTAGVPPSARLAVLLAAVLVLVAREFSLVRLPLPENRRLVPIDVFRAASVRRRRAVRLRDGHRGADVCPLVCALHRRRSHHLLRVGVHDGGSRGSRFRCRPRGDAPRPTYLPRERELGQGVGAISSLAWPRLHRGRRRRRRLRRLPPSMMPTHAARTRGAAFTELSRSMKRRRGERT